MKASVILNPFANHRHAGAKSSAVEQALSGAGIDFDIFVPKKRGDSSSIAASATDYDVVVAAGGDGTVNEVINGLISRSGDGPTSHLGILPLGTGNDFSDMNGIPRHLNQAARIIAEGDVRQIDAGVVSYSTMGEGGDVPNHWQNRYFNNSCGVAMEPAVALEVERMKHLSGNLRYVVGMLRGFMKLASWNMEIHWDGGCLISPTLLLSVANSPRTGGQFTVAPAACMDDGLFDVVFAPQMPKMEVLTILPRLFKGSHIYHSKISTLRTTRLWVRSHPATPIHVDGELLSDRATVINYQVLPGKISLLSP